MCLVLNLHFVRTFLHKNDFLCYEQLLMLLKMKKMVYLVSQVCSLFSIKIIILDMTMIVSEWDNLGIKAYRLIIRNKCLGIMYNCFILTVCVQLHTRNIIIWWDLENFRVSNDLYVKKVYRRMKKKLRIRFWWKNKN